MMIELEINDNIVQLQTENTSIALEELDNLIHKKLDDVVRETAEDFRDMVVTKLEESEIEKRTGELISSWKVRQRGWAHYFIFSTDAEVAAMMEGGTEPHTITGNNWLLFEPENPSNYVGRSERNFRELEDGTIEGDYAKDGLITSDLDPLASEKNSYVAKSVNHPGTKEYGYFQNAVDARNWEEEMFDEMVEAAKEAIRESGLE